MSRRRFIADEVVGDRAALTGEHAVHLIRVLRARVGQQFDIATGAEVRRGRVSLISSSGERIEFELGDSVASGEARDVRLLLAVFKFDRMEWAIEKCTELGAGRIIPLIARRTEIHLAKAAEKRVERWRRIAMQASEQSRRDTAPVIDDPVKFSRELLSSFTGTKIVLAEAEKQIRLRDVLDATEEATGEETAPHVRAANLGDGRVEALVDTSSIALAVGPEGGWTLEELKMFAECGWVAASLGSTILRAETAAMVALAVVMI